MNDKQVTTIEHDGAVEQTQIEQMFSQILELSKNPEAAANITALGELQMKMMDYRKQEQFASDKVAALTEMPSIRKDGSIIIPGKNGAPDRIQGRFVKYENLQAVIDPILASHNLKLTHNVGEAEKGGVTVQPVLTHANGFVEYGGQMPLPLDTSGGKNNTQGAGSSVSYGKRYTATAMLGIRVEDEDTDGVMPRAGYEDLPDDLRALVDKARAASQGGADAYEAFFKALSTEERGFLAFNRTEQGDTWHAQNKRAAEAFDGGGQ